MYNYVAPSLRKPAAQWVAENPVLGAKQYGQETDTLKVKQGNNVDPWNSLPYSTTISIDPDGRIGLASRTRSMAVASVQRFTLSSARTYPSTALYPSTSLYPTA